MMDFFPLRPPAPPTMEADGGARLRRALTSLVGSGLDGVSTLRSTATEDGSPHPIHGKGQGEGKQSLRHALFSTAFLRHSILFTLLAFAPLLLTGCQKQNPTTANYPNRSINLIVPWAAGGGTDRLARFVADALQRRLGQPVIVVNRVGGSGAVGHSAGALAAPDGHTLTMATFELSTMRSMGISKLTWEDFLPVAQLNGDAAAILARADAAWQNLGELLETIRKEPGKLKMSGTSTGGAWDLARSGLLLAAGIAPTNVIWAPTQGSAPALVELLGGHVDVVCCSVPEAAPQIEGR
ncbi:MAG: hypothetical protein DME18_08825 [Verrucomicrobia bacterium]|nr:MAG: hypothetical protein DME18_08825 [Verrucomicrobiota bacterium]